MPRENPIWDFSYTDGFWVPTRTPPAESNLLLAAETLAISFGRRVYGVQLFLEELEKIRNSQAESLMTVNTTTAFVRRINSSQVELCDKYGQFENVIIAVEELTLILSALRQRILSDFPDFKLS